LSSGKNEESKREAVPQSLPEDVATLYSWANVHGAKYRDFSASRREARSQQRFHSRVEPAAVVAAEEPAAVKAVPESKAQPRSESAPRRGWEELSLPLATLSTPEPVAAVPATISAPEPRAVTRAEPQPATAAPRYQYSNYAQNLPRQVSEPPAFWAGTLQQPREKASSRWTALTAESNRSVAPQSLPQRSRQLQPPVLAVFSLAGGVGKTSVVATLGRALAAQGEQVLLVDTNSYGLLPLYYGAQDVRPGAVRTFSSGVSDTAVQLLTLDTNRSAGTERVSAAGRGWLADEVAQNAGSASRILIDVATASASLARQVLRLLPRVLVPLIPDVSSLASLQAVEAFFARQSEGLFVEPVYVLNGFDPSLPLHIEMRESLRLKLGDRLLPFALRRSSSMAEALAEGMTVIDYSPDSPVGEDYAGLSSWLRSVSAPAGSAFRRKRWNELSTEA
jgi:cellulose synthase operon protein YhjQ